MVPSEPGLAMANARALPDRANELLGCFMVAVSRVGVDDCIRLMLHSRHASANSTAALPQSSRASPRLCVPIYLSRARYLVVSGKARAGRPAPRHAACRTALTGGKPAL